MESLNERKELFDWLRDTASAYQNVRGQKERDDAQCLLYNEGLQWLNYDPVHRRIEQIRQVLDIDHPSHRPTNNQITRFVQLVEAATAVRQFDCEVIPPERDIGIDAPVRGQTLEDFLNLLLADSRMVDAWNAANYMRCVVGTWGVGLFMQPTVSRLAGAQVLSVPDTAVRAFNFNPLLLTLDPRCPDRNLEDHEFVVYSDAWSLTKANRVLGDLLKKNKIMLDPQRCKTIGELQPFELNLNRISNGRLFSSARSDSNVKGVMIHEIYRKVDSSTRFDRMELVLEVTGSDDWVLLNDEMRSSPWGGVGMSLRLLHGYRRADSPWSISDVKMMKNRQDALNRNEMMLERQLRAASKDQVLIDRKSMGADQTDEAIQRRITNTVGGIITYDSGTETNRAAPPTVLNRRAPDTWLYQRDQQLVSDMRDQTHRAAVHQGEVKSHTSRATVQLALEEAGAPADRRIFLDRLTAESLCHTLLATGLELVKSVSPAMAARLVQAGFNDYDIGTLAEGEAQLIPYTVQIREGSIRQRPLQARVQMLREDAHQGIIAPDVYARAMSESGIDMPLTEEDSRYARWAQRKAREVMLGAYEYQPLPLGERSADLIRAMMSAMVDRRCTPEGQARLAQAIQLQRMQDAQDIAMIQSTMAGSEQAGGPAEQGTAGGDAGGLGINDILAALEAQGVEERAA